jgi:hypothetical protein
MGVVYKARQKSLNRLVALKMVLAGPHASPQQLARFKAEAEAVAQLQHPNIVHIYEVGEQDGRPFFSLEYVEGVSLAQLMTAYALPPAEPNADQEPGRPWSRSTFDDRLGKIVALTESLARTIHYAHQRGIIHRDLKPSNVLLTADGTPKVADFGLAKRLEGEGHTRTGDIMGTPAYMAPEQAGGKTKEVGPAADVYALGAILYELLTARPPFRAETAFETVLKVVHEDPVPPRQFQPKVPRDLETICLKCLAKDPAKRYASADDLAEDLRRFRAGEPITARPVGMLERIAKGVRRRRELALVSAGAALTLIVVLLVLGVRALVHEPAPQGGLSQGRPTEQLSVRPGRELPADLSLVPRDAFAFVSLRLGEVVDVVGTTDVVDRLAQRFPAFRDALRRWPDAVEQALAVAPRDIERVTLVILSPSRPDDTLLIIVSTHKPYDRTRLLQALAPQATQKHVLQANKFYFAAAAGHLAVHFVDDRVFVLSPKEEALEDFLIRVPATDAPGPLRAALHLAGEKHHLVAAVNLPPQMRRSVDAALTGEYAAVKPLLELDGAALALDLEPAAAPQAPDDLLQLSVRLTFLDEAKGKQAEEALRTALRLAQKDLREYRQLALKSRSGPPPEVAAVLRQLDSALTKVEINQRERDLVVSLPLEVDLPLVLGSQFLASRTLNPLSGGGPLPSPEVLLSGPTAVHSANNLRQIGIAMHNYASDHGHLPPAAITGQDGRPLLSWRVALLPYLEEAELYQQFKLDEPWDSPHNKQLLVRMPKVYAPPGITTAQPHLTYYQVFTGSGTLFEPGRKLSFDHIRDGAVNTVLLVEAGEPAPWTKPDDLPYDPKRPLPKLGGLSERGSFNVVMADGSIRFIPGQFDEATFRALITRDGNEVIDWNKLK